MENIINIPRSVIPACDVDWSTYIDILKAAQGVEKIGAVKVGIALALGRQSLYAAVRVAHDYGLKVIYDHQKAGTDIHESTPQVFMERMSEAEVDAVILFPLSGPAVQYEWTRVAQLRGLGVIIGGEMTHPRFLADNTDDGKKEGQNYADIFGKLGLGDIPGYIRQGAPRDIFKLACRMGVTDFVVPGNKPDRIRYFHGLATGLDATVSFFAPGLVAQGGSLSEGAAVMVECAEKIQHEPSFHGIVGRGITQADDKKAAMEELTAQL